ncbi:MAG: hypothetical protein QN141_10990 [Armatimonadota bacterium]|nr:hypothetical protein [Armatimonadota bacterium]MDR7468155.1 hypothetical protein [Armatimonadota bacterium]MDR7495149.1 hypothetical protein [Armatimonadota bacterium]MDR7499283.1 hypothetical protein [Armatimonadota bacterium]MDR7505107.1 hypothetical protein [Armatimonadota bacterium]
MNLVKKLKPTDTDVLLRIMQIADSPSNLDAMQYILFQFDFKDYEQFILECPPGSIRFNNFLRVAVFCDNLGVLVDGGALDPEVVFELYPIPWAKMEPIVMGMRRELGWPDLFDYFEKLGKQYQKWWEPKAKKIKLPEAPKGEAPRPALRPVARPTLVQATRFARPGAVPARPGAGAVKPAARPAAPARPTKPAAKKPAAKAKKKSRR